MNIKNLISLAWFISLIMAVYAENSRPKKYRLSTISFFSVLVFTILGVYFNIFHM